MDKLQFGIYIKQKREKLNFTQESLSEKINVKIEDVESWESGKTLPNLDEVIVLAKALNISTDELLNQSEVVDHTMNQKRKYLYPFLIFFGVIFIIGIVLMVFEYI